MFVFNLYHIEEVRTMRQIMRDEKNKKSEEVQAGDMVREMQQLGSDGRCRRYKRCQRCFYSKEAFYQPGRNHASGDTANIYYD